MICAKEGTLAAFVLLAGVSQAQDIVDARTRSELEARIRADEAVVRPIENVAGAQDEQGARFGAIHRAGGIRARFSAAGVELAGLSTSEAAQERCARLRLARVGRGRDLSSVAACDPQIASDGRVEYRRSGLPLVEWYENRPSAFEQGFVLTTRPAGESALRLEFAVASSLATGVDVAGERIDFVAADRADRVELRLEGLATFDRNGSSVPSRFEPTADGYAIVVDDSAAEYPLTIDPVASSPAFTAEGNFVNAQFGIALASAGDVDGDGFSDVLVAASNFSGGQSFEGKVYLYMGTANGLASSPAWQATGGQANAYFGKALASAGDVNGDGYSDVLISAQLYDDDQVDEGRVYLYLGSASGLALSAAQFIDGDQTSAQFGQSIACAGDVDGDGDSDVVLGSGLFDFGGVGNTGLAAVFSGVPGGISTTRTPLLGGTQFDARLGSAVASAGDVNGDGFSDVAVAAVLYDDTKTDEGKVFVYYGSGSGADSTADFSAVGGQTGAQFGTSISTAGDVNGDGYSDLIVGAQLYDFGEPDEGRAFVFLGSSTGLASSATWTTESNQTNARHGNVVTTAGDLDGDGYSDVAVSALLWDSTLTDIGHVLIYHGGATGLSTVAAQEIVGTQSSEFFGQSLAFAGDVNGDGLSDLAIGAQAYSNPDAAEGAAFVYHGTFSLPPSSFQWSAKGQQTGANFGSSLGFAGDVNGDGFDDVVFGAPNYHNALLADGKCSVHYGSGTGLTPAQGFAVYGDQNGARLGTSVAGIGDVNGDGYDDIATSAIGYDASLPDVGLVRFFLGSATGLSTTPAESILGQSSGELFGTVIAGAGDVDGDGFVDVLIGSNSYSGLFTKGGRASVYSGGANGVSTSPLWTRDALASNELLGTTAAALGDVDLDGFADIAVGAPGANSNLGRVETFLGGAAGPSTSPDSALLGLVANEKFGSSIVGAHDVNGDGFADAAFGALNAVRIYFGSGAGLPSSPNVTLTGETAVSEFGTVIAGAGDFNRDGYADLLVGAPKFTNGQTSEGKVYVFKGGASGPSGVAIFTDEGDQAFASFGGSLGGGGDVDGDGTPELLVGAPLGENGFTDEGRGFLYYGNGDGGSARSRRPRVLRADHTAPVAHLGRSFASTVEIDSIVASPFGRSNVTYELELKSQGTPFDGTSLLTSSLLDTGTTGSVVSLTSNSLATGNYTYRSRVRLVPTAIPYQPTLPWVTPTQNGPKESDFDVATNSAILVVSPNSAIDLTHVTAAADPSSVVLAISNLGSGTLGYTVTETPDVSWLAASPNAGNGVVAGSLPANVTVSFTTGALTPGVYTTTLTVKNSGNANDQVSIPVTLTVSNVPFVPGDRLVGNFDSGGDTVNTDFSGVIGEKLVLAFDPAPSAPFQLGATILDDQGATVAAASISLSATASVKKTLKLDRSGRFTLRLQSVNGTVGAFAINTSAKLPALANDQTLKVKLKAGKSKTVKFLAFDGSILQFKVSGLAGQPLSLTADTPEGNVKDFTGLQQVLSDGSIKVSGIVLDETGQYSLKIKDDGTKKVSLTVQILPDQPIGESTITLP